MYANGGVVYIFISVCIGGLDETERSNLEGSSKDSYFNNTMPFGRWGSFQVIYIIY